MLASRLTDMSDAVALRKESVDRNTIGGSGVGNWRRRSRKESADRNTMRRDFKALGLLLLSARRAWIEIVVLKAPGRPCQVALRKESVDRNCYEV